MDVLASQANRYLSLSIANSTHHIYNAALTSYLSFCSHNGSHPFPLSEGTLIRYCCSVANRLKFRSIKTYLAGIQFHSYVRGFQHSMVSMHQLYYVLRGIRRNQSFAPGNPRKHPITLVHLALLFDIVKVQYSFHDASMLQSAMSLAFFAMLRASEYTSPSPFVFLPQYTLLFEDLSLIGATLHISLKKTKTDPFRLGAVVRLVRSRSRFCPVCAYSRYIRVRGVQAGPMFVFDNGSFLTRRTLSSVLQRIFPGANINTHSFRIGGASAAASAGISDSSIQILGRWSSNAFHQYLRYTDEDILRFISQMSQER